MKERKNGILILISSQTNKTHWPSAELAVTHNAVQNDDMHLTPTNQHILMDSIWKVIKNK